ncbi:hypothetical protein [Spirulina major]|uniref:hypothetical protein n=1 Tax=Spirulina major TaxID=270636 RepID=UPI000935409C|nr:hypothetical protein [Spirulina major]
MGIFYTSLHLVSTYDLPILVADLMRIDPLAGLVRCGQAQTRSLQDKGRPYYWRELWLNCGELNHAFESGNRLHSALNAEFEISGFFDNKALHEVHGSGVSGIEKGAMVRSPP